MSVVVEEIRGECPAKNLKEVVAIIPEECYDNPTWKGLWYVFRDLLMYLALVLVLLSTDNFLYLLPLWALSGLVVSALFVIGHDAGHHALFKSKKLCGAVGRICMLPSLHNYSAWQLGHNRIHHGFTVHEERDFVWHPYSLSQFQQLPAPLKFLHRLEWSWLGAGIYYLLEVWWKKMVVFKAPAKWVKDIRKDNYFMIVWVSIGLAFFYGYSAYFKGLTGQDAVLYTVWLGIKVIFIPFFLFNYCIGAVVYLHHINPELKWHAHETWSKFKAQMEGTMIYRVYPRAFNIFLHDIMIHVPHHVDMRIPFYNLDKAAGYIHSHYPDVVRDVPMRISDYFRITRQCKLYDFDQEIWLDYQGNKAKEKIPT